MNIHNFFYVLFAVLLPYGVQAQDMPMDDKIPTPEFMRSVAERAPDLVFPSKTSSFGLFHGPQMALYKPDGNGSFPALVLMHQCGGLRGSNNWQNASMLEWAKKAVARGYVVLQVDVLGPRNVDTVCYGPKGGVFFHRGVKDAFQALEHLAKLPYVDPKRIAFAGYSWGAIVGVLSSSKSWADALAPGPRFAATIAFYPLCSRIVPQGNSQAAYDIAPTDIERPLLVLMGGLDTETPPAECVPRLEVAKHKQAPVEWHLYKEATHCWDCSNLSHFSKIDHRGNRVVYKYDYDITADSEARMFDFLARHMPSN
jgi:dienelactone hydrolase